MTENFVDEQANDNSPYKASQIHYSHPDRWGQWATYCTGKKGKRSRQLEAMLRIHDSLKRVPEITGDYWEITTLWYFWTEREYHPTCIIDIPCHYVGLTPTVWFQFFVLSYPFFFTDKTAGILCPKSVGRVSPTTGVTPRGGSVSEDVCTDNPRGFCLAGVARAYLPEQLNR